MTNPTSKLGIEMSKLVDHAATNYCGKEKGNGAATTTAMNAIFWNRTRDDLAVAEKANPLKKFVQKIEFGSIPIMVGMGALFPPVIPFMLPFAAVAVGGLEALRRKIVKDNKSVIDKFDGAKDTLNKMLELMKTAQQEYVRSPSKNREQLQEVVDTFGTLFDPENTWKPGTFSPEKGVKSMGTVPMDEGIEKAVNNTYLSAVR